MVPLSPPAAAELVMCSFTTRRGERFPTRAGLEMLPADPSPAELQQEQPPAVARREYFARVASHASSLSGNRSAAKGKTVKTHLRDGFCPLWLRAWALF